MTTYNKTSLKTFFETNDIPTGQNYADLIDSQINIVESTQQDMGGALSTTELITPRVSAVNGNITGNFAVSGSFSANVIYANNVIASAVSLNSLNITGSVSASNITTDRITASAATFSGRVSANSVNVATDVSANAGTVYASAVRTDNIILGTGIVSAAGTTQGTAAQLTFSINRGAGVTDGSATGFAIPANNTGKVQYLYNNGPSANLYPPTGGTINGLAANAALGLAASAMVTIVHLTASAMAVK